MITIVDYRVGNLASVRKAFEHLRCEVVITQDPEQVRQARYIVVPGVGHFAATEQLTRSGLRQAIQEAIAAGTSFLGICVGMQWMFQGSTEAPGVAGLGVLGGQCQKFTSSVKSPHVGWNQLELRGPSRLLDTVESGAFVYYSHSYRAPLVPETVASTDYGEPFSGVVERDNLFGVQFHPEKSGKAGLAILRNFARLAC